MILVAEPGSEPGSPITLRSVEKMRMTVRRFYTHAMRRLAVLIVAVEVVTIAALYWFGRHFV